MSDTQTEPDPVVRYCHGCKAYDDHPRATVSVDIDRPDLDKLYHYDCLPPAVVEQDAAGQNALGPILGARAKGARGDDLRAAAVKHAASIKEAPAHKPARAKD